MMWRVPSLAPSSGVRQSAIRAEASTAVRQDTTESCGSERRTALWRVGNLAAAREPTVKPYLVRLRTDQKNAREIVGFYVSPSLNHLAEMVDECCPVEGCEYRELGPGGIFWETFTASPVPRVAEPDWESLPVTWSVVPPDPTLTHYWNDLFRTPDDVAADDALWTPLHWDGDDLEDLVEEEEAPAIPRVLPARTLPRRRPRN